MDEKGIVVIPTYNESENISALIDEINATAPGLDILVVDDGSPDGTAGIVKLRMEKDSRIHLMERPGKLGLGTAYVQGFKKCLADGYGIIIQMDSDFSHQPKYLLDFLREIKSHDLILGSRYIAQGGTENWSLSRKILSRGGNIYAKMK
ncbi:MAG: glycosyltransferase, partial [Deltaproteobacteria bacterium]|nr:glycosyltransferase [Deltaproteobacteria bacterium]